MRRSLRSSRSARSRTDGRELLLLERGGELVEAIALVLPELAVDRLELLLQIELALILEERAAHLALDLALEAQDLDLGGERVARACEKSVPMFAACRYSWR